MALLRLLSSRDEQEISGRFRGPSASLPFCCTAPPPLVGSSIRIQRGCQQSDSLADGRYTSSKSLPSRPPAKPSCLLLLLPSRRKNGVSIAAPTCPPAEPGGSARCYWNGYGTQCSHPAQGGAYPSRVGQHVAIGTAAERSAATRLMEGHIRAGWVSTLLSERLRNAV